MLDTHARHWVQPVIEKTARGCLKLGLSANQVTWAAFLIGSSAGLLVWLEQPWWAVAFLWVSGFLDAVDGSMARLEKRTSPWGTLLDITFDRIVELSVIVGIALRYPEARLALLVLTASIVFSMTVFLTVGALSEKQGVKSFYYQAGLAERTEGFLLLTLMVLVPGWLPWSVWGFAAVETFTGVQRMLEARKLLRT